MKKEHLADYDAKEREYLNNYFRKVESQGLSENDKFPEPARFSTPLREPLVVADRLVYHFDKQKIWSQIPFAGTLVIPLHNLSKEDLLAANGFAVDDIPKLIALAKETGRVQFALSTFPALYEGLDHLDPILEELRPPLLQTMPYTAFKDAKILNQWKEEFRTLAKISYLKYIREEIMNFFGHDNIQFFEATMDNRQGSYTRLKVLGMEDLTEWISNAIIDDPKLANITLSAVTQATDGLFSGLRANTNLSLSRIKHFGIDIFSMSQSIPKIKYPVEIGRFLMEKMTLNASTYYGCVDVIQRYEQHELYKVLQSLDKGIREQSMDEIVQNAGELNAIMDNIWKTARRIEQSGKIVEGGLRLTIGLTGLGIGSLFMPPLQAAGIGLLAQLGINAADQYVDANGVGEKVARLLNKRHITTVYDFSKHTLRN